MLTCLYSIIFDAVNVFFRGLGPSRYMTCIAKHPTLRHDELVVLFLNESSSGDITKKLTAGAKVSVGNFLSPTSKLR